jgi:preprotein translocase subunit SecG
MSILTNALLTIWAIVAMFMILVILMQRPKSEGLGAAFGGGVTENLFGAQTTNVLVRFTSYLATFFFLLTFALSILYARETSTKSVLRQELLKGSATTVPSTSSSPSVAPAASAQPSASAPAASAAPSSTTATSPSVSPKKP